MNAISKHPESAQPVATAFALPAERPLVAWQRAPVARRVNWRRLTKALILIVLATASWWGLIVGLRAVF